MAALPLLELRTDGLSWLQQQPGEEPDEADFGDYNVYGDESEGEELTEEEMAEREAAMKPFFDAFGTHEPLKTLLPGLVCRPQQNDLKLLALALWTGQSTFELISAFEAYIHGRQVKGCSSLTEFCAEVAPSSAIAVLALFFAPTLRSILGDRTDEFQKLGCVFATGRGCNLKSSLVASLADLRSSFGPAFADRPLNPVPSFNSAGLREGKSLLQVVSETAAPLDDVYIKKALEFIQHRSDSQRSNLLVSAAQRAAETIDTLWVAAPEAAGPVFRGDNTPESWLDRPDHEPVGFPVATSVSLEAAYMFYNPNKKDRPHEKQEDHVFAILFAQGTRNIDMKQRLGASAETGGGKWLTCHLDEQEILVHPKTVFRSVMGRSGAPIRVGDVVGRPITAGNPLPPWVTMLEVLFRNHGTPMPPTESLAVFASNLKPPKPPTAFDAVFNEVRLVVALPPLQKRKAPVRGSEGGKRQMRSEHWTDFSALLVD